jgi:YesN/AraC family two-component response regulator
MKQQIEKIKSLYSNIKLLYVEDNPTLCKNMASLLSRISENIVIANDGEEGYKKYLEFQPKIVITDINMPKMNGFKMIKNIKALEPECKIIIMSAHDEKEHLYHAINIGIFRYISKPTKVPELIDAIYDTVLSIYAEENRRLFLEQIKNIFNYQNSLVMMMHNGKFILPNHRFLKFFGVDTLKDFNEKYPDMDKLLLEHKDFLYSNKSSHWYNKAVDNTGKLFHAKIKNASNELRHLILKTHDIPEKKGYYVVSFYDVTEMNLMALFDSETVKKDSLVQDKKSVVNFLNIMKNNSAEVKVHNFYKGLAIINPAVITDINDVELVIKSVNSQLKIVQLANFTTISSEILPSSITCKSIKNVDFDKQTITINDFHFAPRSIVDRKYTRLDVEKKQSCTLFYKKIQFSGDVKIVDVSEVSAKVEIEAMSAGIRIGDKMNLTMTLNIDNKVISIHTDSTLFRIDENKHSYYLVLLYELEHESTNKIKEYLGNRQISLNREFRNVNIIEQKGTK